MTALRHFSCGWLLMTLLGGCVTQAPHIDGDSVQHAQALQRWTASGRLGVISPAQSGSGSFLWQQDASQSQVQLRGPVGIGALQLALNGQQLELTASDGTRYAAEEALNEMELRLGVKLPIAQLRYWLIGLPAPGQLGGQFEWSSDATGKTLQQAGWRILYQRMFEQGSLQLPEKLTLTQGEVQIRALIEHWQVLP